MKNQTTVKASRGRPKTLNRDHILDVTMLAYWKQGAKGVSINEICKLAQVSKPGLYREFDNEDGLMKAALNAYLETFLLPKLNELGSKLAFNDVLDDLVEFAIEERCDSPDGCMMVKMNEVKHLLGKSTQSALENAHLQFLGFIEQRVEQARQVGDMSSTMSNQLAAIYIDAQLTAALAQRARGEAPEKVRDVLKVAFSVFK
ncbi:AcrR family transcriptional regulator [Enterovibrio norvegicus FF-33]|uniref:AcrR family transcriptional regulator n=1 Tax=Enterovibrio norvegicus FF-454 TaxID=1185651 RepID=A0A1E5C0V2_9GAMM|nr:TetR/AcrR family transcriptional regulator [Enterovibrio norvegicus]OEE59130.1 AcrR family transcriptional regulator [Enterovibrio norvegicus FF-454]OEE67714.1 AcrR family transcriptional regulator [Enterovibrio norvegicus FF-33]OEE76347.1 AcrR family transcriptional regulator [Enterovibrio norvegicus FF-162]